MNLSFIGSHLLALSLPACVYSLVMYVIGHWRKQGDVILSAQRANVVTFVLVTLATITLVIAFVTNDYSIFYVYSYSSRSLPLFYKVTCLWAGLDGSLLFWTWLMVLYATIVLYQNYKKNADWMPYINMVMMGIIFFFLILLIFADNPFAPMLREATDGKGLNPLLQNIAMVVHPPAQYLGFTGCSVPFAFAIAALITRRLDTSWIEDTRRWTIVAWFFLALGLVLGGAWAYVELGWGGFWAWDPVENAALLPWLTATAYIHSVIIQKRRGMLMVWNVSLVSLTFLLSIFGTYLTRSGVVQSVHAFSGSKLGPLFMLFMGGLTILSFGLIMVRLNDLKSKNVLQSFLSKESSFLLNNVVLLVASFAIIWGTLFPSLSQLFTGQRITVGPPFFNQIMAPIGLVLLFLMGIGPMISWKRATLTNLRVNLLGPFVFGLVLAAMTIFMGFRHWYSVGSVLLISFVVGTLYLEFSRGIRAVKKQKKLSLITSFMDLLIHSNRRYGGYIVHFGILLVFLGIAGTVFKAELDFSMMPGQAIEFKGYQLVYDKPGHSEDDHKSEIKAEVSVYKSGRKITTLNPAKNFYASSDQASTEVDVYQTALHDLYLIIGSLDTQTGRADFRVTYNPLISFIWLGSFIVLVGVVILLLPRGLRKGTKVASLLIMLGLPLLSLLVVSPSFAEEEIKKDDQVFVHKETGEKPFDFVTPTNPYLEKLMLLTSQLVCKCGCARSDLRACTCEFAKNERAKLLSKLEAGKTVEDITQEYVNRYGLEILMTPPKKGFFNVGYWVPPIVLVVALGFGLFIIRTWSHARKEVTQSVKKTSHDDEYAKKLEKELEDFS